MFVLVLILGLLLTYRVYISSLVFLDLVFNDLYSTLKRVISLCSIEIHVYIIVGEKMVSD